MRIGGWMAVALVLSSAPVAAQAGTACVPPPPGAASALAGDSGRGVDVVVRATATAREVRFASEPRAQVRALGCAGLDSVVVTERVNLPDPVQPGVTYRDVRVGIEIRASLDVTCLLPALAADPALAGLCAPDPPRASGQPSPPSQPNPSGPRSPADPRGVPDPPNPSVPANPPRR